jgi:hypothetical protein
VERRLKKLLIGVRRGESTLLGDALTLSVNGENMINWDSIRQYIIIFLLGLSIGIGVGYIRGRDEVDNYLTKVYEREVTTLKSWNKTLLDSLVNITEKRR